MKNISYLLSLLLAFSYVSFADEEVKEAPKESEEVPEEVAEEAVDEEAEEDKDPTISEFLEEGDLKSLKECSIFTMKQKKILTTQLLKKKISQKNLSISTTS